MKSSVYKFTYSLYFKFIFLFSSKNILSRIYVRLLNLFLPTYFKVNPFKPKLEGGNKGQYIVSLTSFPVRINNVWLVIESLFYQTKKPDRILLWLYKGEFPDENSLPKSLLKLKKRGLEIRFCNENLMPHKKYFYTMQEFPDSSIITIDDDMIYPPSLVGKLLKFHNDYPESIVCTISRRVKFDGDDILPYKQWEYVRTNTKPSYYNLTMGGGGTLFPPNSLHSELFNLNILKSKALKSDDLWLKIMSLKNKTKVICIAGEYPSFFIPILHKNNKRLMDINIGNDVNDKVLMDLCNYYNIYKTNFID